MIKGGDWAVGTAQTISESISPMAVKFSVAFTLAYQFFGSVRHAYWDLTAKGFQNKAMLNGSYVMWVVTLVPSIALAFYSLPPSGGEDTPKKLH